MGGDSAAVDVSLGICLYSDEKVFITPGDEAVIGYSGSFRVGQLLKYGFSVPDQPSKKDDMAYMVTDFVDAIRNLQRDKGAMTKENELELHDAELLIGFNGNVYVIQSDYQVGCPLENFAAVGCGAPFALGAMFATKDATMGPIERIHMALSAAAEYCAGVRKPFHVVQLEPEKEG